MKNLLEVIGLIFALLLIVFTKQKSVVNDMNSTEDASKEKIRIVCEKIDGIYYAWTESTKEFIYQSKNSNEVAKHLLTRYPLTKYELEIIEKSV